MGWLGNNLGNANTGATGYVQDIFTNNGTWSCCTGAQRINVIAIGGGGGGYSSFYTNAWAGGFVANTGGAGGAGGDIEICDIYSGFGSSQCVIIGAGGASDTPGATSCFGSLVVAGGGAVGEGTQSYNGGATPGTATALGGLGGTNGCNGGNSFGCAADLGGSGFKSQNNGLPGSSARSKSPSGGGGGSVSTCDGGITIYCGNGGAGGNRQIWAGVILGPGGAGANSVICTSGSGSSASGYGAGGGGAANIAIPGGLCFLGQGGCGSQGVVIVTQFF
jgi:hypothetical protein